MNAVLRLLIRRVLTVVPLILGIVLFVALMMEPSKDNVAYSNFAGSNADQAQIEAFRRLHHLDAPLIERYVGYLGGLIRGDLGVSMLTNNSVAQSIATAFPLTAQLTLMSAVLAIVVALLLGVTSALFRDRWPDQLIRTVSLAGVSAPSFWLGLLMIQYFAVQLGWFPSGGYVNPTQDVVGFLRSMALPAVSLSLPVAAALTRIVRTSMVEELDKDYVRTALGGGVSWAVVVSQNVLRNALINPVTVLGLRIGYLLGGAVVTETIFGLPGMGQLMINAVRDTDLTVLQGVVITIALSFIVVNLAVDLLYLLINPRLRSG